VSEGFESARREIQQLLDALRHDLTEGSVRLFREHFTDDAVVLAFDDPRIFVGKESSMEYLRGLVQQAKFRTLAGEIETIKFHGDVAIVLESGTSLYEGRGQMYRDTGRTTYVLLREDNRWRLTHFHLESMATNPVVEPES